MWSLLAAAVLAAAPQPSCDGSRQHEFDFWIGEWQVFSGEQRAGTNRIESIHGGCALAEHWVGAKGTTGSSLNAYDPASRTWRQFWVDNAGTVLRLEGGLVDGSMILQGELPNASTGRAQRQRVTWTPNNNGTVRQHWEASDDDGKTWNTMFDGLYRRKSP